MKKQKLANIIMVCIILLIAAGGILTAGHIRGWFDKADSKQAYLSDIYGIVTMERDGVAYPVDNETVLRSEDKITTESGAQAVIYTGNSSLTISEQTEIMITSPDSGNFSANINAGELFAIADEEFTLTFDEQKVPLADTVCSFSIRSGAQSINVYEGAILDVKSGQFLSWVNDTLSTGELALGSLNDFLIDQVRSANKAHTLCFSNNDLDQLLAEREQELQEMLLAQNDSQETPETPEGESAAETAEGESITESSDEKENESGKTTKSSENGSETKKTSTNSSETKKSSSSTETTKASSGTKKPSSSSGKTETTKSSSTKAPSATKAETTKAPSTTKAPETTKAALTCTITIRCDTILNNMGNLDPAKTGYVPSSGVILKTKTVEFTEGETVFDVLKRVCSKTGIQLEYSWTPMYNSYYVEGINNLYEFDCGSESGWMYKVNGWFPNYGCSSYTLKSGDTIVWCYTCNGLGADVGGGNY